MFKPQFAALVASGAKRQTIRPMPKRLRDLPQVGNEESWRVWLGKPYRSKTRELVRVRLTGVYWCRMIPGQVIIDGQPLKSSELNSFAAADGFESPRAMFDWFVAQHGLPVNCILIQARNFDT